MRVLENDELAREHGTQLPARQALSLVAVDVNIVNVVPVNLAFALNAASFGSTAVADAGQLVGMWG